MYFFFQAEDGIRDLYVTGVQTCALPICGHSPAALFDGVAHGQAEIILAVDEARGGSDEALGDDLRDEDDAAAQFSLDFATDAEAQIDFGKFAVKWNRDLAEEFCAAEAEADETEIGFPVKGVELGSFRHVIPEQFGLDFVIEHHEIEPL